MRGNNIDSRVRTFLMSLYATTIMVFVFVDGKPSLQITQAEIWESENVTLTCTCPMNSNDGISTFYVNNKLQDLKYFPNKTCLSNPFISHNYKCVDKHNFQITLRVHRQENGYSWTCGCGIVTTIISDPVVITVNVPVGNTILQVDKNNISESSTIQTINSTKMILKCSASCARPVPNITWYMPAYITNSNKTSTDTKDGLICSQSTIYYTPLLASQGHQVYCSASNKLNEHRNSSNIFIDVLYPPRVDKMPNTSTIEGNNIRITCNGVPGNPNQMIIEWSKEGNNSIISDKIDLIIAEVLRSDETYYKCTMRNTMTPTFGTTVVGFSSERFYLTVLYKPNITSIVYTTRLTDKKLIHGQAVLILEGESFNIRCFANSKPDPNISWTGPVHTQSSDLKVQNIKRDKRGVYTCISTNTMVLKNSTEHGECQSNVTVDVLYPPYVGKMNNTSTVEGDEFSITCNGEPGNPNQMKFEWSDGTDTIISYKKDLIIPHVLRSHETYYTCTMWNELEPTIGPSVRGNSSARFFLTVLFPSEINKFVIFTESSGQTFVANKTQNLTFECIADANPTSDLKIMSPMGDYLIEVSQSNVARHTLHNASFKDAGEYICTGRNNYTRFSPSQSKLILIVKSRPRPSSGNTNVMKVATVMNVDVNLLFTALDYLDKPNKTMFRWFKENVSLPDNDKKYSIHSNGLNTNITIRNTTQQDLGLYKVKVENSVGMYTHYYELKATDKPERPRDFRVMNDSITDTSVTLAWRPGFNGGFQQTFVIMYKMKLKALWLNKSIEDNGDINMKYTLNDLSSMQVYELEMFAINKEGISFHTERLHFKTEASPSSQVKSQSEDQSGIIAGSVSGVVIVVIGIVVVIFIFRNRQHKNTDSLYQNVPFFGQNGNRKQSVNNEAKKKKRNCLTNETTFEEKSSRRKQSLNGEVKKKYNSEIDEQAVESLQEVDDVPFILHERTDYCNSQDKIDKIDRITVAELYAYVFGNDDNFEVEYQKLPTGLQNPCTFARKPENIALNRYNGIYPYDHSRVKISDQPEFFINACYIDGYRKRKAYIASLGPTSKTTSDFKTFWEMVWHERSDMIVMLTNLHEPSGMKCERYWPNEGTSQYYGDVTITSKTFEAFAEYTVRTFGVSKGKEHRLLTHLHYTAWPDKTVPEDVTSLLDLRKRMQDVPIIQNGPIVIHCSAGIGRTGTLIALDILIEEGLDKQSVNVFECVDNLRKQRVKMVQTLEQYIYIHKCLVNALSFDDETISKERIHEHFENKNDQQYITLFQKLKLTVETDNKSEQKARLKNMKNSTKNRQEADVPGDRFIVFLNLTDGKEGAEYINAVYVNSFKRKDHFIVAQSPLSNTVTDFVSMIFQEDCSCIATMEDLKEPGMTVGTYLPELNKKATFGNFQVSSSKLEETSAYIIRKIKIKYTNKNADGEKCFYHFQYKNWTTGSKTPGNVAEFVQFISEVEEYANELGEDRSRVVVHCLKANERSCLFCAVAIIIEKLKVEGNVNILNVIRHLRTRRRTAIVSKEQLKFCYVAASAYIKQNKH